jgi:hypothetical protein
MILKKCIVACFYLNHAVFIMEINLKSVVSLSEASFCHVNLAKIVETLQDWVKTIVLVE